MPPTPPTPPTTPATPRVVTLAHPSPQKERRRLVRAELRADPVAEGKTRTISGYAVVYDQVTEELSWFHEVVRPGAAAESLKTADVRCLFNHNEDLILGRNKSKTLRLFDEARGLRFECDLPATRAAQDLAESIARGDVDQCSFGFRTLEDRWTYYDGDKPPLRELLKIEIYDVSPVTFPAYTGTDVSVRSAQDVLAEARAMAAKANPALARRARELELAQAELDASTA